MTSSEAKVGDMIHRSPAGVSYKRTWHTVVSKELDHIELLEVNTGRMFSLPFEKFNKAGFTPIYGEIIAREGVHND
jgi:hypothetical protein